jgi:MSHA biogenesis protein MshL
VEDNRGGIPGTGDNVIGNFLRNANTSLVKKEMVILLKPTIIQGERAWEEDLTQTRARFDALIEQPNPGAPAR